jgi:mono/diheme cytochrome c family protein
VKSILRVVVAAALLAVAAVAAGMWYARSTGLSALPEPHPVEAGVARALRRFGVPPATKNQANPVPASDEVLASGRAHFADHCASCHANDGSGDTEMGRNLFPKAPDMRQPATQSLTDGELFWIIENGIRFTGMPGWSTGTREGEAATWHLVHFIRRLPALTEADLEAMQALNPRSPEEIREEIEAERFLRGEDVR